jgi:hypothetical protein
MLRLSNIEHKSSIIFSHTMRQQHSICNSATAVLKKVNRENLLGQAIVRKSQTRQSYDKVYSSKSRCRPKKNGVSAKQTQGHTLTDKLENK